MATFRQLLVIGLAILLAYMAHIYDNSAMSPQPFSANWMKFPPEKPFNSPERFLIEKLAGPECLTFDKQGYLYTGVIGGSILKINVTTWEITPFARISADLGAICRTEEDVCGRALGMQFDAEGRLVIATTFGIQRIRTDGIVEMLLTEVAGKPIHFANSLVVLRDGSIVFTDSTSKWTRSTWRESVFEAAYDGRLCRFHPSNPMGAKVLRDGIYFSNGIAATPDESAVIYNELGSGCIHKFNLVTEEDKVIIKNFPGFPDNLHRGERNTYLAALPAVHDPVASGLLQAPPFLRKVFTIFVPLNLLKKFVPSFGAFIEFDENGNILNFYKSAGPVTTVTDVTERNGYYYLGSLDNHYIGRMKVKATN